MPAKAKEKKETEFKSEYFDTSEELLSGKNEAYENVKERRLQLLTVRKFTNMLPTLTEEEKKEMGRTEVTNHGLSYRGMSQNEGQLTSMVTVTNSLVEVIVDTDNPEEDIITSQRVSEAINKGAIHHKGKFANCWRKVSGEIVIAGGGPVVFPPKYGWLPSIKPDMLFPPETDFDSDLIPYAFDPIELSICDLKKLKNSVKDSDNNNYISVKNIDELIKSIEDDIKGQGTKSIAYSDELSHSVRSTNNTPNSIRAFWYYEPKWEKSESHVSATLVVENVTANLKTKTSQSAVVIAYLEKAYEDAAQFAHLVCVDSEIGGVKNLDTLRGVAEMQYASALDSEELVNLIMEGAKILARPKVRLTANANKDDVLKWDIMQDTYAPEGVEEMPFKNNTNALQVPLQILSQNAAELTSSPSGGNGDLRVEALERQRSNALLTSNRISEAYNQMESILETVVWRLLAGPTKPGTEGYLETMWVRDYLDKYDIDYKKLAERKYGRFVNIRVRAHRSVGNGDRVQQLETADWLMANIVQFSPQVRPIAIRMAVILRTQDPDLADTMVAIPKTVINSQKITAETESNVIEDIAALGQILPVGVDDIHQDHIPIHLRTMQGWVATDEIRPWDKLDVVIFAGMTEHVMEHIKILLENPATNGEAKSFLQAAQNIIQSAQSITQAVEEREGSDQAQMTPKEQADMALKWADKDLAARKLGLDIENTKRLWEASEARQANIRRAQFTKEIDADRKFKLSEVKTAADIKAKKTAAKKTAKKKP